MVTDISDPDSTTDTTLTTALTTLTTLNPQSGERPESGSDEMSSCEKNVCRNGGTCLTSIDGFQCHCR